MHGVTGTGRILDGPDLLCAKSQAQVPDDFVLDPRIIGPEADHAADTRNGFDLAQASSQIKSGKQVIGKESFRR